MRGFLYRQYKRLVGYIIRVLVVGLGLDVSGNNYTEEACLNVGPVGLDLVVDCYVLDYRSICLLFDGHPLLTVDYTEGEIHLRLCPFQLWYWMELPNDMEATGVKRLHVDKYI